MKEHWQALSPYVCCKTTNQVWTWGHTQARTRYFSAAIWTYDLDNRLWLIYTIDYQINQNPLRKQGITLMIPVHFFQWKTQYIDLSYLTSSRESKYAQPYPCQKQGHHYNLNTTFRLRKKPFHWPSVFKCSLQPQLPLHYQGFYCATQCFKFPIAALCSRPQKCYSGIAVILKFLYSFYNVYYIHINSQKWKKNYSKWITFIMNNKMS